MSASMPNGSINYVQMLVGSAGALGSGPFSIVSLFQIKHSNGDLVRMLNGGTEVRDFLTDTSHLYGKDDFSDGFGTMSNDTWYVGAITKASGSVHYKFALWPYASDGSGTMAYGESVNSGNHADETAATIFRVGSNSTTGRVFAVVGLYDFQLSQTQLNTLKSNQLSAWDNLAPKELVHFGNWDGSGGSLVVATGSSSFDSMTGTVSADANPPSFSYSLGGAPVQAGAMAMFL